MTGTKGCKARGRRSPPASRQQHISRTPERDADRSSVRRSSTSRSSSRRRQDQQPPQLSWADRVADKRLNVPSKASIPPPTQEDPRHRELQALREEVSRLSSLIKTPTCTPLPLPPIVPPTQPTPLPQTPSENMEQSDSQTATSPPPKKKRTTEHPPVTQTDLQSLEARMDAKLAEMDARLEAKFTQLTDHLSQRFEKQIEAAFTRMVHTLEMGLARYDTRLQTIEQALPSLQLPNRPYQSRSPTPQDSLPNPPILTPPKLQYGGATT
nr:uncharacterized protein LOC126531957 [Dermacentor andersoni]